MTANQNLPVGWTVASFGDVCSQPQYGYTTKASVSGDLRLLRTSDITAGKVNWETVPYCSENPDDPERYLLEDGDILVSRAGTVGASHLVNGNLKKAVFASYLIRFKPFVNKQFLGYFLQSPDYWTAISGEKLGIAVPNVNASKLKSIKLLVPPLSEQCRIVEKIEALFNEIDKGVDSLRAAKTDLGLYRQSLLKAAFEGKLTADWRARNPDKLESSDVLLARIRQEREDRYKAALNDWERAVVDWRADGGKGKKPAKPKRPRVDVRSRRKSNEQSDGQGERGTGSATELLWAIPDSWKWATIKQLGDVVSGGTPSTRVPEYWGNDIVWFTPSDLTGYKSKFIAKGGKSLSSKGLANSSARVIPAGSVMFSSRAPVGYVAINTVPAATNQGFKSVVLHHKIFNEYVYHYLKSAKHIAEERATGTTFEELSGSAFGALPIPIPSLNEQTEIARILDIHFKSAEALETEINASLTRADMLRQSILKKAFSGQLVPQDLNDEPASILLERVEAEKSAKSQESKRKQYRRTVATA